MAPSNFQSTINITHITTATALLEIDGVTFLTDPVFGEAPAEYDITHLMPEGTPAMTAKFEDGPAIKLHDLPIIDAVLLSHEDHIDNLDFEGRRLLDGRRVITTPDGAKNLAPRPGVSAIKPWETLKFSFHGTEWQITGVPCTHLPGGEVTGFILRAEKFGTSPSGLPNAVYFTGDTILMPEHDEIASKFHIVVAICNLGDARIPLPGYAEPLQITMGGKEAAELFRRLRADVLVPIHYESWHHFTQFGAELKEIFEKEGISDKICWLTPGQQKRVI